LDRQIVLIYHLTNLVFKITRKFIVKLNLNISVKIQIYLVSILSLQIMLINILKLYHTQTLKINKKLLVLFLDF